MQKYKRPDFDDKAHKENLEDDIAMVWERIQKCGTGAIPLADLYDGGKEDRITVFVSILFLRGWARSPSGRRRCPTGRYSSRSKVAWDIAQIEDAAPVG